MPDTRSAVKIRPPGRLAALDPRELWNFRDLFTAFALRDVRLRYRQTLLGASWVVVQPLLGAAIFAFVFGRVAGLSSGDTPYLVFAFAGLTSWNLFSSTLTRASGSLVANAGMVSKIYFPRILLPFSVAVSAGIDAAVSLGVLALLVTLLAPHIGWALLTLPIWLALAVLAGLGVGIGLSALAVKYRDVQYVTPVATQLLLFISPVAYGVDAVPADARAAVELNPLTGVLEGVRWAVFSSDAPSSTAIASAVAGSALLFGLGLLGFKSMESGFADVI